ncbi:hypothetical protein GLOTRDRAFT_124177 [Gloeophyllum trabeum ATCC 11539]|uniref:Pentacotripeptide-repeat region of PRORP domain-containing protein n=1 Tax=Gloeophyllum trabeum (strain ATCC 11539 / FP-39264 / Madison 617) TaxID=670483 RepID=S7QLV8_GLOTA|nr:uncharacterized protein GLOTRDRAFT_124177 [Gloeophyllum trabeum ATCC 11539]EPQ60422.1 hypothetical protein GLOTRDRAFT_124177 [Gloeophyllum trabeum ATCC 11539]
MHSIRILLTAGTTEDIDTAKHIFSDMTVLHGIRVQRGMHDEAVTTLLKYGHTYVAFDWLRNMVEDEDPFYPSDQAWLSFLDHLDQIGTSSLILPTIGLIRKGRIASRNPDNLLPEMASVILRVLAKDVLSLGDLSILLEELRRDYLPEEESEVAKLWKTYSSRPDLSSHAALVREHFQYLKFQRYNDKLAEECMRYGRRAALKLFKTYATRGFRPQPSTLDVVLGDASSVGELRELEREMDVTATSSGWSLVVRNALRDGTVKQAETIYSEARASGIQVDQDIAVALIEAVCVYSRPLQTPEDGIIDTALRIYEDSVKSQPVEKPDPGIFIVLLRTLLASSNRTKYLPIATTLIQDMRKFDVTTSSSTMCTIILLLWRVSTTFDWNLAIYKWVKNQWPDLSPSGEEYMTLLRAICKAPCAETSALVPEQYFQIVRDMRRDRRPVTEDVYIPIMSQHRAIARGQIREDAVIAARRLHQFLMVEPAFTPSTVLWNRLMETYIAVGSLGDAYRVWARLQLSGRYDNTTLRIIGDACKSRGETSLAQKIYAQVHSSGFRLDQKNWNTWLECLCREDLLDEAMRLLCLEMGHPLQDVTPDVESARVVLACAQRNDRYEKTASLIRLHLPKLWKILPDTLKIRN